MLPVIVTTPVVPFPTTLDVRDDSMQPRRPAADLKPPEHGTTKHLRNRSIPNVMRSWSSQAIETEVWKDRLRAELEKIGLWGFNWNDSVEVISPVTGLRFAFVDRHRSAYRVRVRNVNRVCADFGSVVRFLYETVPGLCDRLVAKWSELLTWAKRAEDDRLTLLREFEERFRQFGGPSDF
jgi:hypothetical protein